MNYRVIVPSARYEDGITTTFDAALLIASIFSEEFGSAEVKRNLCGPEPVLATYSNGKRD